jgi:hypothetical protein
MAGDGIGGGLGIVGEKRGVPGSAIRRLVEVLEKHGDENGCMVKERLLSLYEAEFGYKSEKPIYGVIGRAVRRGKVYIVETHEGVKVCSRRILETAMEAYAGEDLVMRVKACDDAIKALEDVVGRIRSLMTGAQQSSGAGVLTSLILLIEARVGELRRMFAEVENLVLSRCVERSRRV